MTLIETDTGLSDAAADAWLAAGKLYRTATGLMAVAGLLLIAGASTAGSMIAAGGHAAKLTGATLLVGSVFGALVVFTLALWAQAYARDVQARHDPDE